jgi:membrane associated rhomboid family serine protease
MLPIKDHNPTSRPAVVVPVLIGICVIVFLFVQPTLRALSGSDEERFADETNFMACRAVIPYEISKGELVLEGAERGDVRGQQAVVIARAQDGFADTQLEGLAEPCRDKNVWLAIVTSMFLHGGWLHIAFNMLFLWVFGNNIEDRLGRVPFLAFYLLSGVAATYAQTLVSPSSTVPMVGASGAIAGVLGAYIVLYPRAYVTTLIVFFFITWVELPAIVVLGVWFVLQLFQSVGSVTGESGGVAYFAHIGGFVAGMVLLLVFRPKRRPVQPFTY